MYGIFVRESGCVHYAQAIVQGYKPYETRSRNMLKQLVGERVAIIRTGGRGGPVVVGYATISDAEYWTAAELEERRNLTLIPEGSQFDCKGRGEVGIPHDRPDDLRPVPAPFRCCPAWAVMV